MRAGGPGRAGVPAGGDASAPSGVESSRGALAKALGFGAVVVGLLAASAALGWGDALMGADAMARLQTAVGAHPVLTGVTYVALSIVGCVVLALPGVVFALVAGVVFGPLAGTLLCWVAVSLGACVSFLAGRYFLKDALKPRLEKSALLNRVLFAGAHRSDVYLLAVTRLIPVFPYNLQNFAYGVTDVGFAPYAAYSALFMLPGTAVYTMASAGLVDADNRVLCFALSAALLVATLAVAALLKRRAGL